MFLLPSRVHFSSENTRIISIHVLGNHDAYSIPKVDILKITGQQRYQAIDMEGAILIFLDTTKEMNRVDWGGEMDAEQPDWLQTQLEITGDKPVFVFSHHPVYGTTANSTMDKLSIDPQIDMKAVLNKKEGTGFFFCGHNHVNSIVQQDGWHYASCLDIPAFRIVELKDGKVKSILYLLMKRILRMISRVLIRKFRDSILSRKHKE
jgi:Icc protein